MCGSVGSVVSFFLSWTHLPDDDLVTRPRKTTAKIQKRLHFSKPANMVAVDKGGKQQQKQQQLSISLETKMPPDVVAAVLATKSSSSSAVEAVADDEIRKIEKVESKIETKEETEEEIAKEEEEEQRNAVDESLTISMLADEDRESEKSPREDDGDDTKAAKTKEEKSRPTFATRVHEDDDRARIDDWVATVKQQNCQRTSSMVYYDDAMPSLDDLLVAREGWSQEFLEEALTKDNTTTSSTSTCSSGTTTIDPDLDLTFEEYAEVICALLGVPIYKGKDGKTTNRSLIQSLHLAMSLYIEADEEAQQQQHAAEQDKDIF